MKKILILLLAAGMMFSTFACTKNSGKKPAESTPEGSTTEKEVYVSSSVDDPDEPDGLLIANEGTSKYVIVRGANASVSEITASTELQSYLKQISNVELPIVTDDTAEAKYEIVVGKTNREEAGEFDRNELGDDGFVIKVAGKKLYLVGGEKRGTLYSVYTFLEEYLGCRYYSSTVEVVPEKSTILLDENMPEDKQIPKYFYRSEWYIAGATEEHHAKLKLNGDFNKSSEAYGGYVAANINHNLFNLMAPYATPNGPVNYEENADMFSGPGYSQPCLTNPKVIEVIINNARQQLRAAPDTRVFSLGFMDNCSFCTCDNCTKALEEEQGRLSGVYMRFVNQIAGNLKEEFPDVLFSAFAYVPATEPPLVTRAAENILIIYCTMNACFCHPLRSDYINGCNAVGRSEETYSQHRHGEYLVGWGNMCDHILIWNYGTNFSNINLFFPNFDVMRDNVNFFAECGAIGQFDQLCCEDSSDFVELRRYISSKLFWNPDMSEEQYQAYINDFLQGYYGSSWEYIRQYIDASQEYLTQRCMSIYTQPDLQESYYKLEKVQVNPEGTYPLELTADMIINYESTDWSQFLNWYVDYTDQEYFIMGDELFAKAISEAENEEYRARIEKASLQMDYARAFLMVNQRDCGIFGYGPMFDAYMNAHPDEFAGIEDLSSLKSSAKKYAVKFARQAYIDYNYALRDKLVSHGISRTRDCGRDISQGELDTVRTPSYW